MLHDHCAEVSHGVGSSHRESVGGVKTVNLSLFLFFAAICGIPRHSTVASTANIITWLLFCNLKGRFLLAPVELYPKGSLKVAPLASEICSCGNHFALLRL